MLASCPVRGCRTDEAMTNEFAIQTYWDAPPMSAVIDGRAVVMIATSRAEMNARRQRATNIAQNRKLRASVVVAGKGVVVVGGDSGSCAMLFELQILIEAKARLWLFEVEVSRSIVATEI